MKLKLRTLACLLSTACGKPNITPVFHVPPSNFEAASLRCEDANHCPESTGAFVFQTLHSDGLCTGSLISPNLVLTNSHCVPDEFKQGEFIGETRAKVIFAETAGKITQSIPVRRVTEYSEIAQIIGQPFGKEPDYALLELESPVLSRAPLPISVAGFPEDFSFDLFSVSPDSRNSLQGLLQIKHCRTTMGSAYQPSYDNPFAAIVSFSDCEMVHGNSGSAMVDGNGFARGIVQAGLDPVTRVRLAKQFELPALAPLYLATNFACIPLFEPARTLPSNCFVPVPQIDAPAGVQLFMSETGVFSLDAKLRRR